MANRKKACEYCEEDIFGEYQENRNGFTMVYEWYPNNGGLLSITAQANDENGEMMEDEIRFEFNYCPYCGRKLEW